MAQLVCRNLSLGYDAVEVVSGLNFDVNAGNYLCIIGENGAGKSTLMKTLLGLQPPLGGSVALGDGLLANEIGYLPQQTAAQRDFPASVWEIVLSGCQGRCGLRPFYSGGEKRLAVDAMRKMGVEGLSRRCYRELSGGQQRRVLLARALCAARKVLFLDEPAAGLDPQAGAEMYHAIEVLNRQEGLTVIMISHDIMTALEYASHILYLGRPAFFGMRREYEEQRGQGHE